MSRKYKIHDQNAIYFATCTVIYWIDVFARDEYRMIVIDSLKYCQNNKGLEIYAWCIMTNHIHFIIGKNKDKNIEHILRDFKSFTSRHIRKAIEQNEFESRKTWMLKLMYEGGINNDNNKDYQFWQQHNHPIELDSPKKAEQRLDYIHLNPVKTGLVDDPAHWVYSSYRDYCGKKGLLDITFLY